METSIQNIKNIIAENAKSDDEKYDGYNMMPAAGGNRNHVRFADDFG